MESTYRTLEELPKYIWDEGERFWLTVTTDIQGYWNIGYASVSGDFLAKYAIGFNKTLEVAVTRLKKRLEKHERT